MIFHDTRLVIEIDSKRKFQNVLHCPYKTCSCPNGCILYVHLRANILLLIGLHKYIWSMQSHRIGLTFEKIRNSLPCPVHDIISNPMTADYAFPSNNCSAKKAQNKYHKEHGTNKKKKSNKQSVAGARNKTIPPLLQIIDRELGAVSNSIIHDSNQANGISH